MPATLPSFDFAFGSKNGEDGVVEALVKRFGIWNGDACDAISPIPTHTPAPRSPVPFVSGAADMARSWR